MSITLLAENKETTLPAGIVKSHNIFPSFDSVGVGVRVGGCDGILVGKKDDATKAFCFFKAAEKGLRCSSCRLDCCPIPEKTPVNDHDC